jgi:hypothetical protein
MNEDLVDAIQIDDPQIDAAEVARRVRENLLAHGLDKGQIEFPEFAVAPPAPQDGTRLSATLHYDLEQAARSYGQTWVELQPVESRIPFLGRLKRELHRLVIYYVNLLGERQMIVNGALLRALNQMAAMLTRSDPEIAALRREIAELRTRLEQLEGKGDGDR